MFHIVDGITKDMLKECKVWPDVKLHFEHLLSFFRKHYCRTMFVPSCLSAFPELRGYKDRFNTGPPLFEGGRAWGVLPRGIKWLLERERAIRQSWSLDRITILGD